MTYLGTFEFELSPEGCLLYTSWRTRAKIEYIEKALIQMLELAKRDNVTAKE